MTRGSPSFPGLMDAIFEKSRNNFEGILLRTRRRLSSRSLQGHPHSEFLFQCCHFLAAPVPGCNVAKGNARTCLPTHRPHVCADRRHDCVRCMICRGRRYRRSEWRLPLAIDLLPLRAIERSPGMPLAALHASPRQHHP